MCEARHRCGDDATEQPGRRDVHAGRPRLGLVLHGSGETLVHRCVAAEVLIDEDHTSVGRTPTIRPCSDDHGRRGYLRFVRGL